MKYMGSKTRIAKYIVPIIQEQINKNNITEYYEPFVGGCNVIDKIQCDKKYGSDINKYLIALLTHLQQSGDELPPRCTIQSLVTSIIRQDNATQKAPISLLTGSLATLGSLPRSTANGLTVGMQNQVMKKQNTENAIGIIIKLQKTTCCVNYQI